MQWAKYRVLQYPLLLFQSLSQCFGKVPKLKNYGIWGTKKDTQYLHFSCLICHFEYASKCLKLVPSKPQVRRFQPGILNIPAKNDSTAAFHGPTRPQNSSSLEALREPSPWNPPAAREPWCWIGMLRRSQEALFKPEELYAVPARQYWYCTLPLFLYLSPWWIGMERASQASSTGTEIMPWLGQSIHWGFNPKK